MSLFKQAIPVILEHEGGLTDDPNDPGGVTNFGITLDYLRDIPGHDDADAETIRKLSQEDAVELWRWLWDRWGYSRIGNQDVATKVFDMAVNMGAKQAHKDAQRACNRCGADLAVDGRLGPLSIAALNDLPVAGLLEALRWQMRETYEEILAAHPKMECFRAGWMERAKA